MTNKLFNKYRNFRGRYVANETTKLWIRDLIPILESRSPQKIKHQDINWFGFYTKNRDERIRQKMQDQQRFDSANVDVPGILVEGNGKTILRYGDTNFKYTMIDGCHRMAKLHVFSPDVTESYHYVITEEEFNSFLRSAECGFLLEEKDITLKKQYDAFGFPVCVYRYNNHKSNKTELIKEVTDNAVQDANHSPGVKRTAGTEQVLDRDNPAVRDLRTAYNKCYHHFYTQVLDCDFFNDFKITQSWCIEVDPSINPNIPMHMHTHFMSPVCGVYYTQHEEGMGNIWFTNPSPENTGQLEILRNLGAKYNKPLEVPIEEGDIVLFSGNIPHGIAPSRGEKNRISVPTNSTPIPLLGGAGISTKYLFDMSVYDYEL